MKVKTEEKHLDKEWIEMNARLKAFLETGDQEHLHKFRVQIKKLRALLILLESTNNQADLRKSFKPVKKIFRRAGVIRDAYVRLQLSERYNLKNELFETGQKQIIEDGAREFRKNGEIFFSDIKAAHKKIQQQLVRIDDNKVAEYYKDQLEKIREALATSGFDEAMHANRKLVKILIYNHKLAGGALEGKLNLNIDYLDKLQEAIGQWHDNLLAEHLFLSPELNDKPVAIKIKRVNTGVKRNVRKLAKDFLQKAVISNQ